MSQLVQRRRKADGSDEYGLASAGQNGNMHQELDREEDDDEGKFAKSVNLTLLEEVVLLGLKDSQVCLSSTNRWLMCRATCRFGTTIFHTCVSACCSLVNCRPCEDVF